MKVLGALLCPLIFSSALFAFDVEGQVKLEPPVPEPAIFQVTGEEAHTCGVSKVSPTLRVSGEGGVANAVVTIEGKFAAAEASGEEDKPLLDQVQCEFSPHVLLMRRPGTLMIRNSEALLHNVRTFDEKADMLFNEAMPVKGQVLYKKFPKPGRYIVRCGVHKWMHALVIVQQHPYYALTDESGRFKITGIPEGTYILHVWHEKLGDITARIGPKSPQPALTYPAQSAAPQA